MTFGDMCKIYVVIFLMSMVCAPVFAIFVTPLAQVLIRLLYSPFVREKKVQEAKEKGHVITANFVRADSILQETKGGGLISSGHRYVEYEYEYGGKKYKYIGKTASDYPDTITLYFDKKPKHAASEHEYSPDVHDWKKVYLCATVIMVILLTVAGIIGIAEGTQ